MDEDNEQEIQRYQTKTLPMHDVQSYAVQLKQLVALQQRLFNPVEDLLSQILTFYTQVLYVWKGAKDTADKRYCEAFCRKFFSKIEYPVVSVESERQYLAQCK